MLIVALCLGMPAGITSSDEPAGSLRGWPAGMAEQVIIKTLIMLALLEVIRALQATSSSGACAPPSSSPPRSSSLSGN
jgi:hypothetical protein